MREASQYFNDPWEGFSYSSIVHSLALWLTASSIIIDTAPVQLLSFCSYAYSLEYLPLYSLAATIAPSTQIVSCQIDAKPDRYWYTLSLRRTVTKQTFSVVWVSSRARATNEGQATNGPGSGFSSTGVDEVCIYEAIAHTKRKRFTPRAASLIRPCGFCLRRFVHVGVLIPGWRAVICAKKLPRILYLFPRPITHQVDAGTWWSPLHGLIAWKYIVHGTWIKRHWSRTRKIGEYANLVHQADRQALEPPTIDDSTC